MLTAKIIKNKQGECKENLDNRYRYRTWGLIPWIIFPSLTTRWKTRPTFSSDNPAAFCITWHCYDLFGKMLGCVPSFDVVLSPLPRLFTPKPLCVARLNPFFVFFEDYDPQSLFRMLVLFFLLILSSKYCGNEKEAYYTVAHCDGMESSQQMAASLSISM